MNVREQWETGVQSEIDFWRSVFIGEQEPAFKQEMLDRIDPDTQVESYITARLPEGTPVNELKILDVAAGPISCIGWKINNQFPQITAIDALARQYRAVLDEFHLAPPVYTQECDGEKIPELFQPNTFHLVHIRNALDHCYDPVTVVRNMLSVLKSGGFLIVCGYTDEAEFGNYDGLHQWNIRADEGHMIIWRPGERHDVNTLFGDQLASVDAMQDDEARWTSVTIRKK